MSTLAQEKGLLMDRDLTRKLAAAVKGAPASAWVDAAVALNHRSMPHLAAEVTEEGLRAYPREDGLWMEHIKAVAFYGEELLEVWKRLEGAKRPPADREVLLALVEYYQERDAEGVARLKKVPAAKRRARYHEVLGHYAMAGHDFREALAAYKKARSFAPRDLCLLYHTGEAYHALGDSARSMKALLGVVARERHFVQAWNALCQLHLDQGQEDRARQAMGMALSVNPRDWGVYFTYADHHLDEGNCERALSILEDVLELQPRTVIAAEVYNYIGYLHYLEGEYAVALPAFRQALALNPQLAVARVNLGNLHFHLKQYDEARACYQEALKGDPRQASASCQLGLLELEQGNLEAARDPLERALILDPQEHWAHLGLSEYHRRTRNAVDSLKEAQLALHIVPQDADVHNYLGIALECNRRYFDAEKTYRKALELDPRHRWAANNLGYLYEKIMRVDPTFKDAAIQAWKTRLLICRDTQVSMRGALSHLEKLGVRRPMLRKWLEQEPGPVPGKGKK